MFSMSRVHGETIIPHSHRFDFRCLVIQGAVRNRVWARSKRANPHGMYTLSDVTYEGELGKHKKTPVGTFGYDYTEMTYITGQEYSMEAEEFHSIYFGQDTEVLFFEGVNRLNQSQVLEPFVHGETIPLFKTEPWMFSKPVNEAV